MSWSLYPVSEFASQRERWQSLCEQRYGGHPFLDVRFVEAALDAFGDADVQIAVAADAIALVRRRSRLVVESFCPSQLPMALLMCHGEQMDGESIRSLLRAVGGQLFGLLHFDELVHRPLAGADGLIESVDYAPTMNVELEGEFDAYWQQRSKNLRRNISRYLNRAARDGFDVTLDVVTAQADMAAAVAAYGDIESAGWKGERGSAIHSDNDQGSFYRDLLERFAARGDACVCHLRMNDEIVASRMLVQGGGTAVILKTTYDEAFARFAPGRVLLYLVLEKLFANPRLARVEFYTKANADQQQWATGTRMIRHYNIYRNRVLAAISTLVRRSRGKTSDIDSPNE